MKKRTIITMIVMAVLTLTMTMTALAGEWKKDNVGWWYQNDDGSYTVNNWQWIDGNNDGVAECYYFDNTGYMWTNAKPTPDGYTVDANGAWVVNGQIQTKAVATQAAPAVTETAAPAQTGDYSGVFGIYDYSTGTYTNASTLVIKKNADGSYHVKCDYMYGPFEFTCQVEVINGYPNFNDPAGESYVLYSEYTHDFTVLTGATMESFGVIQ